MDLDVSQDSRRLQRLALGVLLAATLVVFSGALDAGFYVVDDLINVADNPHVQVGFDRDSVAWSFTTTHGSNWMPLAWLSYLADAELWGRNPAGYHAQNLAWHLAAVAALFFALRRLTRNPWASLGIAALFAIHPLHVESVLWINERKDLISGFFFALTLWAYAGYVAAPGVRRYLCVFFAMALGLLAKPMLVTLPFVLLLLDAWPLDRSNTRLRVRIREKLPLFGLALLSSLATLWAQQAAIADLAFIPFDARIWNALQAYVLYPARMFWPVDLAVHYPHAGADTSAIAGIASGILLLGVSAIAFFVRKRHPYAIVGWLWYVGMLVPVIGIVQVGTQASADRYTYLPLIGLFLVLIETARAMAASTNAPRSLAAAVVAVLALLAVRAHEQVGFWASDETLLQRALAVTDDNFVVEYNLGWLLAQRGEIARAESHFARALAIQPDSTDARLNLAAMLGSQDRVDEAIQHLETLLAARPNHERARLMLALAERQRAEHRSSPASDS